MTNSRNPDRPESPQVEIARLVSGILDGTYKTIEDAQIAFEKSRLSKRRSYFISGTAANDDRASPLNPQCVAGASTKPANIWSFKSAEFSELEK